MFNKPKYSAEGKLNSRFLGKYIGIEQSVNPQTIHPAEGIMNQNNQMYGPGSEQYHYPESDQQINQYSYQHPQMNYQQHYQPHEYAQQPNYQQQYQQINPTQKQPKQYKVGERIRENILKKERIKKSNGDTKGSGGKLVSSSKPSTKKDIRSVYDYYFNN